ncbi:MAG TPA: flagellar basal body P-ring protein FlgI, partial [Gemmataceae bacterium]|nr:flagellar basal body P-ring protein FlgI [Gemmataceae bacterium]
MNRRFRVVSVMMAGILGCFHPQTRLQAPDDAEPSKEVEVQTIGEVTSYSNADPIHVSGVGVVTGLDGTGGDAPPGSYRTLLEKQLLQMKVDHVKEILAAPNNSMVLVSASIPPGAHKGDLIDMEVSLPPFSKTTSLRGGYLKPCYLYNYDSSKNLNPAFEGPDKVFLGHILSKGEGPLMLGFGETDDANRLIKGQIWSGARCNIDRPLFLVVNPEHQSGPMVQRIAQRINQTFHGPFRGPMSEIAEAKTKGFLVLQIPLQYKYNLPRFMRVVRLIPLQEGPAADSQYARKLERDLLNPSRTVTAALRLEALGNQSVPTLKRGLESDHALVRFAAAEALAYLGNSACGEELARLTEEEPPLRAFCLTALTSLDESISHVKLGELLAAPDPQT